MRPDNLVLKLVSFPCLSSYVTLGKLYNFPESVLIYRVGTSRQLYSKVIVKNEIQIEH